MHDHYWPHFAQMTEIVICQIISFPGSLADIDDHIAMMQQYRHKMSAGRFWKIVSLLMKENEPWRKVYCYPGQLSSLLALNTVVTLRDITVVVLSKEKQKQKQKLSIVRILEIKKSLQKYTEQPLDHQSLIFCFLIDYKIIIILGLFLFFRLNAF